MRFTVLSSVVGLVGVVCGCSSSDSGSKSGDGSGGADAGLDASDTGGSTGSGGTSSGGSPASGGSGGSTEAGAGGATDAGTGGASDSGSGGANAEAGADGAITTVTGTVYQGSSPAPGIAVIIDGVTLVTDANGQFTATGVGPTYDATIIDQTGTGTVATQLVGLTTRTPFLGVGGGSGHGATVSGQLSGVSFPNSATQRAGVVCFTDTLMLGKQILGEGEGPSYGPIALSWFSSTAVDATLLGLAWDVDGSGLPTAYTGWATQALTVSDGGSFGATDGGSAGTNLSLTPLADRTLTGTITLPQGLSITQKVLRVGAFRGLDTVIDSTQTTSYAYKVPTGLTGIKTVLHVFASGPGGEGAHTLHLIDDSETIQDVSLLAPPVQVLPIDGATQVDTATTFSFTAPANTVRTVEFADASRSLVIDIFTTGLSVKIPDLTSAGIALQKGGTYTWLVTSDDLAQTTDQVLEAVSPAVVAKGFHSDCTTAERTFVASTQ